MQADASAKVIGPSLTAFATDPSQLSSSDQYDLATFLDLTDSLASVDPSSRFAGIAWHELENCWRSCQSGTINAYPFPLFSPQDVASHVSAARALMAQHSTTGTLPIFITESIPRDQFYLPGMAAGYIAVSEGSGIADANRTCFGCSSGFDGLFVSNPANPQDPNPAPTGIYWVYNAYAAMLGNRVSALANAKDLIPLATWDGSSRVLKILIGRAGDCGPSQQGMPDRCPTSTGSSDAASQAKVNIHLPIQIASVTVTEQDFSIEEGSKSSSGPVVVFTQTMIPVGQDLTVPLNSLRNGQTAGIIDGDAYLITVQM